jgi:hypothetical protein
VTRRSTRLQENHTALVPVCDFDPVNTRSNRCATPIATTWERPVAAARRINGITLSIFRSGQGLAGTPGRLLSFLPAKAITGIWLAWAKDCTARRNCCPR